MRDVVKRFQAEALLLGTVILWGFNFTTTRYGVTHNVSALSYAALRWVLSGAALAAVAWARGQSLRVGRRDFAILAGAAAIGVVISQVAFVYSLRLAPAAAIALIFGTLPIFISLISRVSGVEQLHPRHWFASLVSFLGVSLVAVGTRGKLGGTLGGTLLALAAAFSFALYTVAVTPVLRRRSPLVVNAISALVGAPLLLIVAIPALLSQSWGRPSPLAWGALLYSGLIPIVIGNSLWFMALNRVGPSRASLFANLQPFIGAVFALLVLSERLSDVQVAGGFVIACGILLGKRTPIAVPPSE